METFNILIDEALRQWKDCAWDERKNLPLEDFIEFAKEIAREKISELEID